MPLPGDIILYNWDCQAQPNDGYSDHIGYVESVSGQMITVMEGNYNEEVAGEVIQGKYGNGEERSCVIWNTIRMLFKGK